MAATHEQLIIGWTGDIESGTPGERVPASSISQEDKDSLEEALATYIPREADPDDDKKTQYIPVWQDDKVAHGHYDGYCKTSKLTSLPKKFRVSGRVMASFLPSLLSFDRFSGN